MFSAPMRSAKPVTEMLGEAFVQGDEDQLRPDAGQAFRVSSENIDEGRANIAALSQSQNHHGVTRLGRRRG